MLKLFIKVVLVVTVGDVSGGQPETAEDSMDVDGPQYATYVPAWNDADSDSANDSPAIPEGDMTPPSLESQDIEMSSASPVPPTAVYPENIDLAQVHSHVGRMPRFSVRESLRYRPYNKYYRLHHLSRALDVGTTRDIETNLLDLSGLALATSKASEDSVKPPVKSPMRTAHHTGVGGGNGHFPRLYSSTQSSISVRQSSLPRKRKRTSTD